MSKEISDILNYETPPTAQKLFEGSWLRAEDSNTLRGTNHFLLPAEADAPRTGPQLYCQRRGLRGMGGGRDLQVNQ